jgi:hypothetical protein
MSRLCCVFYPPAGTLGTDPAHEKQGLEAAISALLNLQSLVLRPDAAGAAAAKYICSVASAVAERDADLVAGAGCWQALPLAQLLLQCVSRPEREVRGPREACKSAVGAVQWHEVGQIAEVPW